MDLGSLNKECSIEVFWIVITIDAPLAFTFQIGKKCCIKWRNSELMWKCKKYWKRKILVFETAGHSSGGFFPLTNVSINKGCFFPSLKETEKQFCFTILIVLKSLWTWTITFSHQRSARLKEVLYRMKKFCLVLLDYTQRWPEDSFHQSSNAQQHKTGLESILF